MTKNEQSETTDEVPEWEAELDSESLLPGVVTVGRDLFGLAATIAQLAAVIVITVTLWLYIIGEVPQSHAIRALAILVVLSVVVSFLEWVFR